MNDIENGRTIKNETDIIRFEKAQPKAPKYLYKYFNNLEYVKAFLETKKIHFEKLTNYNDVFDGATSFDLDELYYYQGLQEKCFNVLDSQERNKVIEICKKINDRFITFKELLHRLDQECVSKETIELLRKDFTKQFKNLKPGDKKCTCFSETCDSELMWATYGDRLKGACLVFETALHPNLFRNAQKVNYTNYRTNKDKNDYFTKSMCWSYEQEWRIILNESPIIDEDEEIKEVEYLSTNACVAIIIGEGMSLNGTAEKPIGSALLKTLAKKNGLKIKIASSDHYEYKINIIEQD